MTFELKNLTMTSQLRDPNSAQFSALASEFCLNVSIALVFTFWCESSCVLLPVGIINHWYVWQDISMALLWKVYYFNHRIPSFKNTFKTLWKKENSLTTSIFSFFQKILLELSQTFIIISFKFTLSSANAFNLDKSKILSFGKVSIHYQISLIRMFYLFKSLCRQQSNGWLDRICLRNSRAHKEGKRVQFSSSKMFSSL